MKITHTKCLHPSGRLHQSTLVWASVFRGRGASDGCNKRTYFYKPNLSVKSNCAANVKHEQRDAIERYFVFSGNSPSFSRVPHITIRPSQRLCFSCLVFITPGWGVQKETQYDRVRVQPGKRNTVNRVLVFFRLSQKSVVCGVGYFI